MLHGFSVSVGSNSSLTVKDKILNLFPIPGLPGRDPQCVGVQPQRGVRPGARRGVRHGDCAGAQAGGETQMYQGDLIIL